MLEEATVVRLPVGWLKMTAPGMVLTTEAPAGVEGVMALVIGDGRTEEASLEDGAAKEMLGEYEASELDVDEKLEKVVEEVAERVVEEVAEGVVEEAAEEVVKEAAEGAVEEVVEGVVKEAAEEVVKEAA
jgi:uncharacterized membrane protein